MATDQFNNAAAAPESYAFDLAREVAAFYAAHPVQQDRVFFIDASTFPGAVERGGLADEDDVITRLGASAAVMLDNKQVQEKGSSLAKNYYEEGGFGCIFMNVASVEQQNLLGAQVSPEISKVFIFDHEVGHLLCRDGLGSEYMGEMVADAYAALRLVQRFGAQAPALQSLVQLRAVELALTGDGSHFSSPVVARIIADARTVDFAALTPEETAAAATRYAHEASLDRVYLNFLAVDFRELDLDARALKNRDFKGLKKLGDFLLQVQEPALFTWGATALRALVAGDVGFDGERLPQPQGPEWPRALAAVEARASRFQTPAPGLILPPGSKP